jgi:hypothetical protein
MAVCVVRPDSLPKSIAPTALLVPFSSLRRMGPVPMD